MRKNAIAYCGLACFLCSKNLTCPGCRDDGCDKRDTCKCYSCCSSNNYSGCWECEKYPCSDFVLKSPRANAFIQFIREYGVDTLIDCLERNENSGINYHYESSLNGDYDVPGSESDIISLILHGK